MRTVGFVSVLAAATPPHSVEYVCHILHISSSKYANHMGPQGEKYKTRGATFLCTTLWNMGVHVACLQWMYF
jgi:hypothetical protein